MGLMEFTRIIIFCVFIVQELNRGIIALHGH